MEEATVLDLNQVHYILGDQEFILQDDSEEMGHDITSLSEQNIICTEGNAVLVNGECFILQPESQDLPIVDGENVALVDENGDFVQIVGTEGPQFVYYNTTTDELLTVASPELEPVAQVENLKTGQELNLKTNIDKLQDEPTTTSRRKISNNKKKMVGKILHIKKNNKVKVNPTITNEVLVGISKTLSGIMQMESVKKKLHDQNLRVKFVVKKNKEANGSVTYCKGHMSLNEANQWGFFHDDHDKYPTTLPLTITCSKDQNFKTTIRVSLNQAPDIGANLSKPRCRVCMTFFESDKQLQQHLLVHVDERRLFMCSKCGNNGPVKLFENVDVLHRHWAEAHSSKGSGSARKQKGSMPFTCFICYRSFSRHSNLLRHAEIHKGTGALYKCDICYCAFKYVSSLTRHMVKNHIDASELRSRAEARSEI